MPVTNFPRVNPDYAPPPDAPRNALYSAPPFGSLFGLLFVAIGVLLPLLASTGMKVTGRAAHSPLAQILGHAFALVVLGLLFSPFTIGGLVICRSSKRTNTANGELATRGLICVGRVTKVELVDDGGGTDVDYEFIREDTTVTGSFRTHGEVPAGDAVVWVVHGADDPSQNGVYWDKRVYIGSYWSAKIL